MSDMDVDEIKNNMYNSLLKNKPKDGQNEEQTSKSKRVVFQDKPIILNKVASKSSDTLKTESNEGEKNRDKKERQRPPTKVVIRRLPPSMTQETFIDHVSPLPENDYLYFVKADLSLGPNGFSRAYINFIHMSDLLTFHEQFDNYVFMDNKGNEYPAVVEFAPFQRVPRKRLGRKKDPKAGTLKEDPSYISFVASLQEKKDASATKQTSAEHLLALTTEGSSKKEVTTPLLEFLKQRRAERQRARDEKREERRRKELERKRIKDEERRRRKDGDSVLKVLRNPEHEDKDDTGKGMKDRDRPHSGVRRREEERRNRDKDKKDRQMQDNRQRDMKGRDSGPKSYREDRQKQMDNRLQRKAMEDQRKKPGGPGPGKQSDTRRSQEFDRQGQGDVKKTLSHSKDMDQKKPYGERFQGHMKDVERHSRESEPRKSYRESDNKRNQGYDHRKSSYSTDRKFSHNYNDSDPRRRSADYKSHSKNESQKQIKESKVEAGKSQDENEGKKWELLGAKPKLKPAPVATDEKKPEQSEEVNSEEKIQKPGETKGFILKRRNSADSGDHKQDGDEKKDLDIVSPSKKRETSTGVIPKRRNSLESETQSSRELSNVESAIESTATVTEQSSVDTQLVSSRKSIPMSKSQEFEKTVCSDIKIIHKRRSSLDSGDHEDKTGGEDLAKLKRNHSVDSRDDQWEGDGSQVEEIGAERKRDPRVERRIRNKDRPSIEIYRPGMGRFSMQRKEREKGVGSSTEQESPSTSPSPTPSGRASKSSKTSQELRSMTFKRSVSREK